MNININLKNLKDIINPKFFPLLTDHNRFLVLRGSANSGKSVCAAQKCLLRILIGYKTGIRHRILVVRKTANSIRESTFAEFKKWITAWGLDELVRINKSNLSFEFTNGSEVISVGCDDVEKLKSISGITSIWIEEPSQLSLGDFRQINLRLRGITHTYMQLILTFNPISRHNWLYNYFYIKDKSTATLHHSTWRDNLWADPQSIAELKALKEQDEGYWKVYSEGEWGSLKDLIYQNWKIIKEFPKDEWFKEIIYGCDFGFNDPSVLLKIGLKDDEFYIQELLYRSKLTNGQLIEEFKKLIPDKFSRKRLIYCDAAEPARIKEICNAGFRALSADKSVKDGLDYIKRHKLHVYQHSIDTIKEIEGYKYRETKDGDVLEEPVKFHDHSMDAMRYPIYTHYGKIRPKASIAFA